MRTVTILTTGKKRGITVEIQHSDVEYPIGVCVQAEGDSIYLNADDAEWLAKKLVKAAKIARKLSISDLRPGPFDRRYSRAHAFTQQYALTEITRGGHTFENIVPLNVDPPIEPPFLLRALRVMLFRIDGKKVEDHAIYVPSSGGRDLGEMPVHVEGPPPSSSLHAKVPWDGTFRLHAPMVADFDKNVIRIRVTEDVEDRANTFIQVLVSITVFSDKGWGTPDGDDGDNIGDDE